jgi:hypothetical protein
MHGVSVISSAAISWIVVRMGATSNFTANLSSSGPILPQNSPSKRVRNGGADHIEQGSPWENGYCESFNGKLRDECLNGEIFYSLKEAQIVIEKWRIEYNTRRPHSALGYRPPAPAACSPWNRPNQDSRSLAV